jgi:hypothetical protein
MTRATGACFAALAVALVLVPRATAKQFEPGDLRICNAVRCVPLEKTPVLGVLATFYYGPKSPPRATAPALGAPFFQLRFDNDYVTGIVASSRLDRFLSYGVNLGHFRRGRWYRPPSSASAELQRLTAGMRPLRLSRTAIAKSR